MSSRAGRCADGVESLLDPSVAYCTNPGEEQRYDHPQRGGDDCTTVALDPATAFTQRARRALVDQCREDLAADPDTTLPELARQLAVSPHHLSRAFHQLSGQTISHHRMLLRGRAGLERITGGERDLARLAADLGFSDQSHLCRILKALTAHTPSALRNMLS